MAPKTPASTLTVDVHSHVKVPKAAAEAMTRFSPELDPRSLYSSPETNSLNRAFHESVEDRFTDPQTRLRDMETMGVDVQALALAPPQYFYWLDEPTARGVARMQNDHIAAIVQEWPDRFRGIGTLPLAHPTTAVAEAERLHGELGMRGIEIGTDVVGADLDDPRFEPIWEAVAALGLVVILHPAGFTEGRRFTDYYLVNVIGLPLSSTLAVTRLILGGVFERHPGLRMVVVHGGGYLPFYSARTDHAFRHRPEMRRHIDRLPSEYLANLWFDSTVFSADLLETLVRVYGADRVLMGTDYPFDMGQGNPLDFIASTDLTEDERALILGENANQLFGFGLGR
ncbi:MAG TPA: amidohydrolase family protein [Acidimicrobiia bacterium]|nr:amidohydrolase family protein [Acidimicrobiia bacterium]